MIYLYDAEGSPIGMKYRGGNMADGEFEEYWFEKNLQGDIVAVYDAAGTKLISYTYDAWGNFTTTYHNGCTASHNANLNPFRYRGYYYDSETGLYYLQSRYYDPAIGRFISADQFVSTGCGILGYNMYAYCNNNAVKYCDPTGNLPNINSSMITDNGGNPLKGVDEDRIYGFDEDDIFSENQLVYRNISEEEVVRFYTIFYEGDYAFYDKIPIVSCFIPDWLQKAADVSEMIELLKSGGNTAICDPQNRRLYIERGYTVVEINRVYIGDGYSAAENEYFFFNQYGYLVFHDTIEISYFID